VNQLDVTQRLCGDELSEALQGLFVDVDGEDAPLMTDALREALSIEAMPGADVGNAAATVDRERGQDVGKALPLLATFRLGNGPAWNGGCE
jgi:hypothetical protein